MFQMRALQYMPTMCMYACMIVYRDESVWSRDDKKKEGVPGQRAYIDLARRSRAELNDKEGYKMLGPIDVLEEQVVLASVEERREV